MCSVEFGVSDAGLLLLVVIFRVIALLNNIAETCRLEFRRFELWVLLGY